MLVAVLGFAVAGSLLLQTGVSHAAPPAVHIEDQAGDANGVNAQGEYGFGFGLPTGPAQLPEADLVEVDFRPARRGYMLSFRTSAPASTGYVYGITASLGRCRMFLHHEREAEESRTVLYGCGSKGVVVGEAEQQRGNMLRVSGIPRWIGVSMAGGTSIHAETLKLVGRIPTGTFSPVYIDKAAAPDA